MIEHYFKTIREANQFVGLPQPEHSQLFVHIATRNEDEPQTTCFDEPLAMSTDFYTIGLKEVVAGEILYGRAQYDLTSGTMLFFAPRQRTVTRGVIVAKSSNIIFHEDFVRGHAIQERIKRCHFFDYTTNEALHLAPKEKRLIHSLFEAVEEEYYGNPDQFSKEIILSHIETVLQYAERFYQRQFLHRQEMGGSVIDQFTQILAARFESGAFALNGTPRVEEIAQELGMSRRSNSDALKAESGKTAIENIHLYLIDVAKNLLLEPQMTAAATAYQLGFETPQYFARLFKKKVGLSPTAYQANYLTN
ncbi:helix-turn-helix transcriptional regulator [Chloroflexi bacterium TSY]|nr:helix-turn-helix transcriptional regulator [Chloroflexi bacterium TSY]